MDTGLAKGQSLPSVMGEDWDGNLLGAALGTEDKMGLGFTVSAVACLHEFCPGSLAQEQGGQQEQEVIVPLC